MVQQVAAQQTEIAGLDLGKMPDSMLDSKTGQGFAAFFAEQQKSATGSTSAQGQLSEQGRAQQSERATGVDDRPEVQHQSERHEQRAGGQQNAEPADNESAKQVKVDNAQQQQTSTDVEQKVAAHSNEAPTENVLTELDNTQDDKLEQALQHSEQQPLLQFVQNLLLNQHLDGVPSEVVKASEQLLALQQGKTFASLAKTEQQQMAALALWLERYQQREQQAGQQVQGAAGENPPVLPEISRLIEQLQSQFANWQLSNESDTPAKPQLLLEKMRQWLLANQPGEAGLHQKAESGTAAYPLAGNGNMANQVPSIKEVDAALLAALLPKGADSKVPADSSQHTATTLPEAEKHAASTLKVEKSVTATQVSAALGGQVAVSKLSDAVAGKQQGKGSEKAENTGEVVAQSGQVSHKPEVRNQGPLPPELLQLADKSLRPLFTLPPEQTDNALKNLAQRILALPNTAEGNAAGQVVRSDVLTGDIISEQRLHNKAPAVSQQVASLPVTQLTDSFVASLKAGLAEMKAQLQQGREPGLDLSALIQQSMQQPQLQALQQVSPQLIQQSAQQFSQLLDFAQGLSGQLAQQFALPTRAEMATMPEVAGVEQRQLSGSQSTFDKAVNIFKPEGQTQLVEKVRFMVASRLLQADIRLDPPEMGSMQVRVNVSAEAASVAFVVQSPQARDAIDQAVPRLREMLAEKGIELGQSSVHQQMQQNEQDGAAFAENGGQADEGANALNGDDGVDDDALAQANRRAKSAHDGLIDYFA